MASDDDSDDALIASAGRGDRVAASVLVTRHSPRVFSLCMRMLRDRASAEDATQETFLKLWEGAARWRPNGARLETWLYRVASNACLDRHRMRRRIAPDSEIGDPPDLSPSARAVLAESDTRRVVDEAIAALPERQRLAVTLRHFEELTNIEIAQSMGLSVEAVESLLGRARRALKAVLADRRDELMEAAE